MKLLFIQGGSRWKKDQAGNLYTDSNFNEGIWKRYQSYCDKLTVVLRSEEKVYEEAEARERFNFFNPAIATPVCLPDVYSPVKNTFNLKMRREIAKEIDRQVQAADRVIIRSIGTFYTDTALRYVRKYQKIHLVEVTGFSWEAYWYHSLRGKFYAPFNEIDCKLLLKDVPSAVYVTQSALQKRYPNTKGNSIGCSDVELMDLEEHTLERRMERIRDERCGRKIILGTAAFLDVGWKGQKYVIQALSELKKKGVTNLEYQLIGNGTGETLKSLARELGVEEEVRVLGGLSHDQVFGWMDQIDIYIQPSFMEGLCRSIVEAMSRACPVLASNVGGNNELISMDCIFKKGSASDIMTKIEMMALQEPQIAYAKMNFEKAKEFRKDRLDQIRDQYYREHLRLG